MIDMIINFLIEFRLWEGAGTNGDDHRCDKQHDLPLGSAPPPRAQHTRHARARKSEPVLRTMASIQTSTCGSWLRGVC